MQGDNALRTLYDSTPAIAASHQHRLFDAEREGEIVIDYLRTISPLSVIYQLLVPFLGASCYILDHVDPQTTSIPVVAEALAGLKKVVLAVSRTLDRTGAIPDSLLTECQEKLQYAETIITQASSLLQGTQGDEHITQALLSNQFDVDLVHIGEESCRTILSLLLQANCDEKNAESSLLEVWGEGRRGSEDGEVTGRIRLYKTSFLKSFFCK